MISKDTLNQVELFDESDGSICYLEHGLPSDLIRWHAHEPYELHLIVSTKGKVFVGDYIGRFQPGQLILTGPHVPHNWVSDKDSYESVALRDMVVLFSHESIEGVINSFPEAQELMSTLKLASSGVEFVGFDEELAKELFAEVRDASGINRLMAFIKLMGKLHHWPNKQTLSTSKMASPLTGVAESKINDVVRYITDHYQDDLSLKQAAKLVSMSESSFSRHFQKATRNKFVEFVNRVRVGKACILLAESDERISSICFSVGFNNITNFNRQFYRIKGQTPGEYRKVVQDNLGNDQVVMKSAVKSP